jgi:predicted PilT family ATPase
MMVPQDQVGSIIGRAGFKIKELRERSGAFIKVRHFLTVLWKMVA